MAGLRGGLIVFHARFYLPLSGCWCLHVLACSGTLFLSRFYKRLQVNLPSDSEFGHFSSSTSDGWRPLHRRNGSVVADYQLKFLIPEEEKDWLRNFTLSREMVFNIFRQFLYDQEADPAQPLYIAPDSLRMF